MVFDALCTTPLAKHILEAFIGLIQPFYAHEYYLAGSNNDITKAFALLEELGPKRCFYQGLV